MKRLKVSGLKLRPGFTQEELAEATARKLRVAEVDILEIRLLRQALDARDKRNIHNSVAVCAGLRRGTSARRHRDISAYNPQVYTPPTGFAGRYRPVVAGSGPAGLFCALLLAGAGARPILVERGQPLERRVRDVDAFFQSGMLRPDSNVQFGEGGAGTFSDGKLSTGTRDIRQHYILEQLVRHGAPEDILYMAKPHIGTDYLRRVVHSLRGHLLEQGADVLFGTCVTGIDTLRGGLCGVRLAHAGGEKTVRTDTLVMAVGHSARDTFAMLHESGVAMQPKPFAVGVRIEHAQHAINAAQYGDYADYLALPAATYKTAVHPQGARGVYSFCVCPGGSVVGAASEVEMVATNGMSKYARDGKNSNGALLVGVTPQDYGEHPLAGIAYQRGLERAAYALGGGGYHAPATLVGDFLAGRASTHAGGVSPTYRPGVVFTDIAACLPGYVTQALRAAIPMMAGTVRGFDAPDAVLTAVESRSSSPVRILRGEDMQANIRGLYPCGEGAGYAGGIMSAAVDGIKAAEAILRT